MGNNILNKIGTVKKWMGYGEISDIANKIANNVKERVIISDVKSNTIANPKSALNFLSLKMSGGDKVELIIIGETAYDTGEAFDKISGYLIEFIDF